MSLQIIDNTIHVSVPKFVTEAEINKLIQRKQEWIKKQLVYQQEQAQYKHAKFVEFGSAFYLGKSYSIECTLADTQLQTISILEDKMLVRCKNKPSKPKDSLREIFATWYVEQANNIISKRLKHYTKITQLQPAQVVFKNFKARWGSYSSTGKMAFNWRLIMAPLAVIDYVVVHELCHIKHYNHSKAFWQTVESYLPEYKVQKLWLKEQSWKLAI